METKGEVKVFCCRCISVVHARILRIVEVKDLDERIEEVKMSLECPNCGNVFPFEKPVLKKEVV